MQLSESAQAFVGICLRVEHCDYHLVHGVLLDWRGGRASSATKSDRAVGDQFKLHLPVDLIGSAVASQIATSRASWFAL